MVSSDSARGSRHVLNHMKFSLNVKKHFFYYAVDVGVS